MMFFAPPTGAGTLERQERRFALALFAPAFLLLLITTTAPLVFLVWSARRGDWPFGASQATFARS